MKSYSVCSEEEGGINLGSFVMFVIVRINRWFAIRFKVKLSFFSS